MQVTTTDTHITYYISLKVWTGLEYSPDIAEKILTDDVENGRVDEEYLAQLMTDVITFNSDRDDNDISWYKHSSNAYFMKLKIEEVEEEE